MDQLDDIHFWSRQLSEHALFMNLGLEVEPYKTQAKKLHDDWEAARKLLEEAKTLEAAQAIVLLPTNSLGEFQQGILDQQRAGKWCGWLFPSFIDHTLRELRYFVSRVWFGGLPPANTFCQNVKFMEEHADFAAHLLDPTAKGLVHSAKQLARQFEGLHSPNGCMVLTPDLIRLGQKAGLDLDAYLQKQPVSADYGQSVIHPVLAEHVVREGKRFLETLDEIRAITEPQPGATHAP